MKLDGFLLGMVAAVGLASVWPHWGQTGGLLHLDQLGQAGIVLVFFMNGLGLSTDHLKQGASRWPLHLLVQACTFVIFPVWWCVLNGLLGRFVPHDLVLGFFYLAALPSTVSSSVAMTSLARGNVAAAIFNATLSTLLGVVLTPLLASVIFGSALGASGAQDQAMPLMSTMLNVGRMLLLPLVVGHLLRPWLGAWYAGIKPKTQWVDRGVILMIVWCSFSDSVADGLWVHHGLGLLVLTLVGAALFLMPMLCFATWAARRMGLTVDEEIVAVFCGSKKTLAVGVPMARLLFAGNPAMGVLVLPIMFYHQLQLLVCSIMARRYSSRLS